MDNDRFFRIRPRAQADRIFLTESAYSRSETHLICRFQCREGSKKELKVSCK